VGEHLLRSIFEIDINFPTLGVHMKLHIVSVFNYTGFKFAFALGTTSLCLETWIPAGYTGGVAMLGSSRHVLQHKFDFLFIEINAPLSYWNTHVDMFHDFVDYVECWEIM
jgi:hypothetical protein